MKGRSVGSRFVCLLAATGLVLSACNSTPTSPPTISTVAVTGTVPAVGSTAQFTCTVTLSDSSTKDVTSTATWNSSNTAVATVSSTGVVTVVGLGTSVIEATYAGVEGTDNITVTIVTSVAVTGTVPAIGSAAQLTSTATLSNGTTQDVSSSATWTSSNTAVATVGSTGVVTAVATGTSVIQATYSGVTGTLNITVQ
jgi:uncharacterized protein YjdB